MEKRLERLETLFKALADQTRLRILALLAAGRGEVCVCDIHDSLKITQPKASRHLAYLKRAGLVEDRKEGLWVYYRLSEPTDKLVRALMSSVCDCLEQVQTTTKDRRRLAVVMDCCTVVVEPPQVVEESEPQREDVRLL